MRNVSLLILAVAFIVLSGCEDVVDVDSGFSEQELVVDAWLNNDENEKSISIFYTQDYYDSSAFEKEGKAEIEVRNGAEVFPFSYAGEGNYVNNEGRKLGDVGDTIRLSIKLGDDLLSSESVIKRVPEIDSLVFVEEENLVNQKKEAFAEFYAQDFPGQGDTYWIRAYRNDTLLNKPQEMNLSYDGTFDRGSAYDGLEFIRPIRLGVNAQDKDGALRSLEPGDKVQVDLLSISEAAFRYLQTIQEQATNGDNSIFPLPINNAVGNITDENGKRVIGFFQVMSGSSISGEY